MIDQLAMNHQHPSNEEDGRLPVLLREVLGLAVVSESRTWNFRQSHLNMDSRAKPVRIDSARHKRLLKQTIDHLMALKNAYPNGSANRHVISQACTRLKRVLARFESVGELD
jgi:hypothetical protein